MMGARCFRGNVGSFASLTGSGDSDLGQILQNWMLRGLILIKLGLE